MYAIDFVFCVDATASMSRFMYDVKKRISWFPVDLRNRMEEEQKIIDFLRVKVIAFRDYYCDGDRAMEVSPFYDLDNESEKKKFEEFVHSLRADGGGDEPECGLEALALAMKSGWTKEGERRRHIIALFTDASAHPLEFKKDAKPGNYPVDIPTDINQLADLMDGPTMHWRSKRLLLFAPDAYPWTQISQEWRWENAIHHPASAGAGLSDIDYDVILNTIKNAI